MTVPSADKAVNIHAEIADVIAALAAAQAAVSANDLEPGLRHLVTLRASQINGCAFCIRMHVREALEDGESHDRLHRLVGWRHMTDFTPAEKAALAWTEALTALTPASTFGDLRAALRAHYSDRQIAQLTAQVAMINLWNRVQAAGH